MLIITEPFSNIWIVIYKIKLLERFLQTHTSSQYNFSVLQPMQALETAFFWGERGTDNRVSTKDERFIRMYKIVVHPNKWACMYHSRSV